MFVAQQTAEDIKKNAYTKADCIIKEAELKATRIEDEATQKVLQLRYEYDEYKRRCRS